MSDINLNHIRTINQQVIHLEYDSNGGDIILGTSRDDVLVGDNGDDILDGKEGNDDYIGGLGSDTFVFRQGHGTDNILDFQNGVDHIGLANGLLFEDLNLVQQGDDVLILVYDQTLGMVSDIQASQLTAEDFISVPSTQFEGLILPVSPQTLVNMD
ncbi:calcium-binding protein [Leptolyngbya sp. Heron Island J]|uniref:hypothetical protein n=1 Tax=Leptolyngbya sp. Heron Island J TaxID=1385935 RepID=UPI0003B97F2C|nr:hypothetical protein [Leptolyngbya sp. Heron Island J]ESA38604.1 calcium-binding protein [Leptolyngbya sp. Heron Island J]